MALSSCVLIELRLLRMQPEIPHSTSPGGAIETPWHHRLRIAGYVVLVLGLLGASVVYFTAAASPELPDYSGDRGYNLAMERMGGKASVYLAQFNRWLASLWHGTNLAFTIAVLAAVVAMMCFWLANFLSYPMPPQPQPQPQPDHPLE